LAFSAGTFLCISLSDLLPELQFHQHDRVKLSLALVAGLGIAYAAGKLEAVTHSSHSHAVQAVETSRPPGLGTTRKQVRHLEHGLRDGWNMRKLRKHRSYS
jgi:hypothetical protein